MSQVESLTKEKLSRYLDQEGTLEHALRATGLAQKIGNVQEKQAELVRHVAKSGDLELMINCEKDILNNERQKYANSGQMFRVLTEAIKDMEKIEQYMERVADPKKYKIVDDAHSTPESRGRDGLPFDEARHALSAHYLRLSDQLMARSGVPAKRVVMARRDAMLKAADLYADLQTKALGLDKARAKGRGRSR
jgi:hypothetical protein